MTAVCPPAPPGDGRSADRELHPRRPRRRDRARCRLQQVQNRDGVGGKPGRRTRGHIRLPFHGAEQGSSSSVDVGRTGAETRASVQRRAPASASWWRGPRTAARGLRMPGRRHRGRAAAPRPPRPRPRSPTHARRCRRQHQRGAHNRLPARDARRPARATRRRTDGRLRA
jgi:hypothetical protein